MKLFVVTLAALLAVISASPRTGPFKVSVEKIETNLSPRVRRAALSLDEYRQEQLVDHNNYRDVHDASPLSLDANLNAEAQAYAEHLAQLGSMTHCTRAKRQLNQAGIGCDEGIHGNGENLAWSSSQTTDLNTATKMWYDEVCLYDFGNHGFSMETGHFTQVVWRPATLLGIGRASGSSGTFVVARYNVQQGMSFATNVGDKPASLDDDCGTAGTDEPEEPVAPVEVSALADARKDVCTNLGYPYPDHTPYPDQFGYNSCWLVCGNPASQYSFYIFPTYFFSDVIDCKKSDGSFGVCSGEVCN
ncbi:unnamed protein product [Owenia fusiformis]|uniref:Uncharacterized protein n=1 Tax=Owenia fusiformis TaxID=6347 RepID=A0A8J1YB32_OWEFU|nr:unnamed protein product [Owenia fusiformis]